MHILITGGTGFIGQRLCRALLAKGYTVCVYSRNPENVKSLVDNSCEAVDSLQVSQLNQPPDAIINLAGEPIADSRWTAARKQTLRASRVETTSKLVDLCAQLNPRPRVLVSASAVGYYGAQQDDEVTENTTPHPEFTHELCREWELEAMKAQELGIRVAIARIGLVVGKGGFLKKMLPPFKLGVGGKLGNGKQWMPWIHIDDMINILLFLLEQESCRGAYNAVAPKPVTNAEFTATLGKVVNRPTVFTVPKFVLEKTLGELAGLLLTGQKAFPQRLVAEQSFTFQFENLEAALRDVS